MRTFNSLQETSCAPPKSSPKITLDELLATRTAMAKLSPFSRLPKSECQMRNVPSPETTIELAPSEKSEGSLYWVTGRVNVNGLPILRGRRERKVEKQGKTASGGSLGILAQG